MLRAFDVVRSISETDKVNALGFCIGGTLLASALAVCAARGEQPAASVTLLTTLLDFTDTGDLGLLVTEQGVAAREAAIGKGGLLKGEELAQVFASLRANDLMVITNAGRTRGEGNSRRSYPTKIDRDRNVIVFPLASRKMREAQAGCVFREHRHVKFALRS